jgi:hypothetical protein
MEDITVVGVTMRDIRNAPIFLRLGARMRGPVEIPIGTLKRVLISNLTCSGPLNEMPSIISGVPGHAVEDILAHIFGGGMETVKCPNVQTRRQSRVGTISPINPISSVARCCWTSSRGAAARHRTSIARIWARWFE